MYSSHHPMPISVKEQTGTNGVKALNSRYHLLVGSSVSYDNCLAILSYYNFNTFAVNGLFIGMYYYIFCARNHSPNYGNRVVYKLRCTQCVLGILSCNKIWTEKEIKIRIICTLMGNDYIRFKVLITPAPVFKAVKLPRRIWKLVKHLEYQSR